MPEENRFTRLFQDFTQKHILILGDVMIDSYLWGKVDRISPEAPVPVVALHKRENRLGGAANVALNVKAMGATPVLCTVIGTDRQGDIFSELLDIEKMQTAGLVRSHSRITTTKYRVIGNNVQMLRVDEETTADLSHAEEKELLSRITALLDAGTIDAIILQDYNKGVLTTFIIKEVIRLARSRGIPTAVDPKKKNFEAFCGVTLFKPNLKELREGMKLATDTAKQADLEAAATLLQNKQDIEILLLTLSEQGVMVRRNSPGDDSIVHFIGAHKRNIADVSGAGDTVISLASLCLASGCDLRDLAAISNLAGGLVCEEVGVVPIQGSKLLNEVIRVL